MIYNHVSVLSKGYDVVVASPLPSPHVEVPRIGVTLGEPEHTGAMPRNGPLKGSQAKGFQLQFGTERKFSIREHPRLLRHIKPEDKFLGDEKLPADTANVSITPGLQGSRRTAQQQV